MTSSFGRPFCRFSRCFCKQLLPPPLQDTRFSELVASAILQAFYQAQKYLLCCNHQLRTLGNCPHRLLTKVSCPLCKPPKSCPCESIRHHLDPFR